MTHNIKLILNLHLNLETDPLYRNRQITFILTPPGESPAHAQVWPFYAH